MTCKGMNCTSTDGKNHSPECRAEYAATVAGGRFVKVWGSRTFNEWRLRDHPNIDDTWVIAMMERAWNAAHPAPDESDKQEAPMRLETTSEHIARDIREGRFPQQSERRMIAERSDKQGAHTDDEAVDRFAQAMKEKMAAARVKGRDGWEQCDPEDLSRMLREHVEKGDPRDVANFCMMLWNNGEDIGKDSKLEAAISWIESREHGDNCFVSSHYPGDPGNRCNCGKDSILNFLGED